MPSPNQSEGAKEPTGIDHGCITIQDLEIHAQNTLDVSTLDYYNEGAEFGVTTRENREAFNRYRIQPRILKDVSNLDTSIEMFGTKCRLPIGVAPTAMQCLSHSEGELGTAEACAKWSLPMALSTISTTALEKVAEVSQSVPKIMQIYMFTNRQITETVIARAKAAGFKAVFVTVDSPCLGRRHHVIRHGLSLPSHLTLPNVPEELLGKNERELGGNEKGSRGLEEALGNPGVTWDRDIPWLKRQCHPEMQVWLKGVTSPQDAKLAVQHGVDGIVVSNHGGRQLDGMLASLDALPRITQAVGGKLPVHFDGGIRQGQDIFKALALGADFVWVGRPILWGLAYNGSQGVQHCFRLLEDELRICMTLAGTKSVPEIAADLLVEIESKRYRSLL